MPIDITNKEEKKIALTGTQIEETLLQAHLSKSMLQTKTYYISNNGLDTNNGLTHLTPFKTIAKALTLISDYTTLKFECGSVFYEPLVYNNSNLTFESYGVGNKPVIDGSSVIATPTLVSGNVYTTTNTYVSSEQGRIVIFENGVPMQPVASQAECEALANSYVTTTYDSKNAGTYTTMFHTSDNVSPLINGKVYRTNARDCIKPLNDTIRNNIKVKNIDCQYSFYTTPLAIYSSINGVLDNCNVRYGNKHNAFIADYGIGKDIVSYGAELQGEYNRTATLFVAYSLTADAAKTFKWDNCAAINDNKKLGVKQGSRLTGFLDHAPNTAFKKGVIQNCYGRGLDTPFASNTLYLEVVNSYFEKISGKVLFNSSTITSIKDSFFQGVRGNDSTTENNTVIFNNSTFIKLKYSNCYGDLTFKNCLFFNEYLIGVKDNMPFFSQNATTMPIKLRMNNCIIFGYYVAVGVLTTDYIGDYNIFYSPNAPDLKLYYNGVLYSTLADWKIATSQDTNSVYLTEAQSKTFFLTNPNTGVVTINPYATVTASNGTVYTGTFPDGTLLTDKFTNKNYSHLKSKYVDELDLLQYQN